MNFRNEKEIFQEIITDGKEKGFLHISDEDIPLIAEGENTENQYIMDLSTHAYLDAQLESNQEEIYTNMDLNTAYGEGLDRIGRFFRMARAMPQAAQVYANISLEVNEEETTIIPSGTALIIDPTILPSGDEYVTTEDVEITQGTTVTNVLCENTRIGFTRPLEEGSIQGFENYPRVTATNTERGTTGADLESDESFRQRIQGWPLMAERGSKEKIDDYMLKKEGVNGYKLIPLWNGPGTLKIIVDCLPALLETIQQEVYETCMNYTDDLPEVELPGQQVLQLISLQINLASMPIGMTQEELKQLIGNHVYCFIHGGATRNNMVLPGLSIGADFVPSQLLTSLMNTFPEILNVKCNHREIIPVDDNQRLTLEDVLVGFL